MNVTQILRALLLLYAVLTLNKSSVTAVFERCKYNYNIYPGYTYNLKSENYPGAYTPGSSCLYRYSAPANHHIEVTCNINLDKGANGCTTESFYIAANGNANLQGSERLCGAGETRRHSVFNSLVLAYVSKGSVGKFACSVRAKSSQCECGWSVTQHIGNGEETAINEYPSMVALKTRARQSELFCSAVIISNRYLLTAAHCALHHERENIVAWVGRHNIDISRDTMYAKGYYIKRIIVHEQYTKQPVNNDIALLETSSNIEFSRAVGPICLPPHSNVNNEFEWQNVEVVGWGSIKFTEHTSSTLQKISVLTTDYETCRNIYKDIDTIFPTQICTRDHLSTNKDSYQYDSGGPVIFKHKARQYLVGIVSFGKCCIAGSDPTGVNTRVTSYLAWIYQNTKNSICTIEL